MMRCKFLKTCKGFTLIEVIIGIVIAALFGSMLFQFMSTSVISSSDEVVMVQQGYDLIGIMEKMTADYDELIKTDSDPLTTFKGYIEENTPDYGTYTITTAYIQFDGTGIEESDTSADPNLLKVTIKKGSQSLTAFFSQKS
ncbi:MAG: type II secretion system protein [Deltaproteobacteria bacterium]|nr:type II secretion system protein [Deltaproteobacteria bacterium]